MCRCLSPHLSSEMCRCLSPHLSSEMCCCWGVSLLRCLVRSSSWWGESSGWRAGPGAAVAGPEPLLPLRGPGKGASSGHDTISTPAELSSDGRLGRSVSGWPVLSSPARMKRVAIGYSIQGRQRMNRRWHRLLFNVVRLNVKMCYYP